MRTLYLQNQDREPKFGAWVYQRPDTISKSRSRCQTPVRNLQRPPKPKWGLKGHGSSLHLRNQDREPKLGSWLYERPVTISKSRSRCQTSFRDLQHPHKPQIRTLGAQIVFAPSNINTWPNSWLSGQPAICYNCLLAVYYNGWLTGWLTGIIADC